MGLRPHPIEMKIVSSLRLEVIFDGVARHRGVLGSFDLALSSLGDWLRVIDSTRARTTLTLPRG
jgi:hypothetical protein